MDKLCRRVGVSLWQRESSAGSQDKSRDAEKQTHRHHQQQQQATKYQVAASQQDLATARQPPVAKIKPNLTMPRPTPPPTRSKSATTATGSSKGFQSGSSQYELSDPVAKPKRTRLATLTQIGEDWLYLAMLGIIMALLSFTMDTVIALFLNTRVWLSRDLSEDNRLLQYLGWCITPIVLVTFSSGFVHLCSPTAIGSGIPEMKTILRGVVLNEYLTFRTLVAKIVGLTFTLGSGLPLGKEGPFVHMASIVATLLSKLVASFHGIYENESRTTEMLSAACAVGVAATFYAPIGGVLFSIEVTTVYFAVRNYWRGFFAACCGATIWRLLGFWIKNDESISALFKTNFRTDYPFDPIELLVFSFIGATCGLAGATYIKFHREIVQFFRRHKRISGFLQKNRFVYPILVTLIITTVTFPPYLGKYTASTLSTHTTIEHLFSNRTWSLGNQDLVSKKILDEWTTPDTSFHLHLILYIAMLFWTSALASTIPIPSGLFIPVLKMGAAYGRLIGELMHQAFPDGIKYGEYAHPASIIPGSYAVVGAAALSGAVTHTISTSVILFEMTGQIVHIIPVILGVLIANAVCQSLQPSIYDSIIEIKKLPYLPPIASSNSVSHKILVRDFMNTNLAYVWKERCTYNDLKSLLADNKKLISFPLVESPHSMKLLGSVARSDLLKLLYLHLGRERRLQEVCRRNSDTLTPAIHLLNTISGRLANADVKLIKNPTHKDRQIASADCDTSLGTGGAALVPTNQIGADGAKLTHCSTQGSINSDRGLVFSGLVRSESSDSSSSSGSSSGGSISGKIIESVQNVTDGLRLGSRDGLADAPRDETSSSRSPSTSSSGSDASGSPTDPPTTELLCAIDKSILDDSHRLILKASHPIKYGATELSKTVHHLATVSDKLQSELNPDNSEGSESGEGPVDMKPIAKIVDLYNRGSSMDAENLEKSTQEVAERFEFRGKTPDIVVVVPMDEHSNKGDHISGHPTPELLAKYNNSHYRATKEMRGAGGNTLQVAPLSPLLANKRAQMNLGLVPGGNGVDFGNRLLPPLLEVRPASAGNAYAPPSPSLSTHRPKSILKSSSTMVSLNNMYKRNISSQSFNTNWTNDGKPFRSNYNFGYQTENNSNANFTLGASEPGGSSVEATPLRQRRKVRLPRLRVVDMTAEEQEQWEKDQLNAYIDISKCQIDEAPFQLVEQTSLYRVHTLFSMLGLNHAYVTSFGCLVGIVALKDIRFALEKMFQE